MKQIAAFLSCFTNAPKTFANQKLGYTQLFNTLIKNTIGAVDSEELKNTGHGQHVVRQPSLCGPFMDSVPIVVCGQAQCL